MELQGIDVDKIVLFGSYANGTNREDSDIDLVVISKDFNQKNFWERIDILSDAIYKVFEPIEAVAMTPEEWGEKESIIIDYVVSDTVIVL